jgi:hypothetical protein
MSSGKSEPLGVGRSYFIDDESSPCNLCARPAINRTELRWRQPDGSKGVDYACESCRAALEAAQGILDNEVEDEDEIITTIALAAYAGLAWTEVELEKQSPEDSERVHSGLTFSRLVDGMPLFRMLPISVDVARYDGTTLPKEIIIRVSSRAAQPKDVALCYEQCLATERIPSDKCPAGSVTWKTEDANLTITIKPGAEIPPDRVRFLASYPVGLAYRFPPVSVVQATYEALLGSVDSRTFRGYAYALGYHGRPPTIWKRPETNVLACLACCFGELDTTTRPAERHPRISRALNRHVLSQYGIAQLPEDWSGNGNLRKNIKKVGAQFMRASFLWQEADCPPFS